MSVYLQPVDISKDRGIDNLYQSSTLWKSIKLMCIQELPTYHTEQSPIMTDADVDFAYGSLFPFLKQIIRKHYRPDVYPESQSVLIDILKPICAFSG